MISNDFLHIRQTAVTELDILFVNYLIKAVAGWEVFIKKRKKFFANIGGNASAKRWIEPNDIACDFISFFLLLCVWVAEWPK